MADVHFTVSSPYLKIHPWIPFKNSIYIDEVKSWWYFRKYCLSLQIKAGMQLQIWNGYKYHRKCRLSSFSLNRILDSFRTPENCSRFVVVFSSIISLFVVVWLALIFVPLLFGASSVCTVLSFALILKKIITKLH